jgi:hypothetical protein
MNTSSSSAEGDEANKRSPWNGFVMGVFMCLMVRHVSNNYQSWWNGGPPAKVPVQSAVDRSHATLAYWRTAVENLHEIRFQVPTSELPSEQVFAEMLSRLKTLTDQAKVAPWDNVDQDLWSMATGHFFVDDRLFQLKAEVDEWVKQNPTSPANATSFNEATAQWQKIVAAVQADSELLDKLPQGPERKILEAALEFEQQRLDQFHEIESMQSILQKRYPGLTFPLPEISQ